MAIIDTLSIHQFRNLNHQFIKPGKYINLFIADNAQGKTNLIEAIYYLSHNRSFKTRALKELIQMDFDTLQLSAIIDSHQLKLEKSKSKTLINIDHQPLKNTSTLTKILPIQIITPDKGFIVNGAPKNKRSYLDWGVFHVKPELLSEFKKYKKVLKNINTLLIQQNTQELDFWLAEIAKISSAITGARLDYLSQLKTTHLNLTVDLLSELFGSINTFDYQFKSGYIQEIDALDSTKIYQYLHKNKANLLKIRQLNYGPHKANIRFSLNGKDECFLSRGEQKTLSIVFWLTQVALLIQAGVQPVVLIDDLSSELDNAKIKTILHYLDALNVQTFMTDINPKILNIIPPNTTVFSIKNGVISPQ